MAYHPVKTGAETKLSSQVVPLKYLDHKDSKRNSFLWISFFRWEFTLPLNLLCDQGWPWTSNFFSSTSKEIVTGMCYHVWFVHFYIGLGLRLKAFCTLGKHSTKQPISSAPIIKFFKMSPLHSAEYTAHKIDLLIITLEHRLSIDKAPWWRWKATNYIIYSLFPWGLQWFKGKELTKQSSYYRRHGPYSCFYQVFFF